jgi:predicted metal-dependent HD superfamily phosphohydrolase
MTGSIIDYDRFQLLWQRCLFNSAVDESAAVHQQIIELYSEPQRFYHTLTHIEHCLSLFDKIRHELEKPDAIELAIWFHDVIYQPGAKNNEQLSADLFMGMTKGIFDDEFRDTICRHIMATVHNGSEIQNADTKYLLDIDLSSFGRPWVEFIRDSDNLRLEMGGESDEIFYQKQAMFQDKLFARSRFFKSDYFYDNFEAQARQNRRDYSETVRKKTLSGQS